MLCVCSCRACATCGERSPRRAQTRRTNAAHAHRCTDLVLECHIAVCVSVVCECVGSVPAGGPAYAYIYQLSLIYDLRSFSAVALCPRARPAPSPHTHTRTAAPHTVTQQKHTTDTKHTEHTRGHAPPTANMLGAAAATYGASASAVARHDPATTSELPAARLPPRARHRGWRLGPPLRTSACRLRPRRSGGCPGPARR